MNEAGKDRKKALKILFTTYWSSKGWKAEKDQVSPRGNLLFDKRAGIMFHPVRLSHEEIVRRAIDVRARVEPEAQRDQGEMGRHQGGKVQWKSN